MPKPLRRATKKSTTPKRPFADPNLRVHQMMAEHAAKVETSEKPWDGDTTAPLPSFQEQYSAHMAKLGAKGGKVSGAKRMENLTPKQRKEIAKKAAAARWEKKT